MLSIKAMTNPLVLRLIASSVSVAKQAGVIVRDVMKKGELAIVEKAGINDLQTEADRKAQNCIITSLSRQFPKISIIGEEIIVCPPNPLPEERNIVCYVVCHGFGSIPLLAITGLALIVQKFQTLDPDDKIDEKWIVNSCDESVFKHKCPEEWLNVNDEDVVVWVDPLDGTSEYTQGLLDHVTVLIGLAVRGRAVAGVIHQPYYNYQTEEDGSKLGRTIWGLLGLGAFGITPKLPPEGKVIVTTTRSHSSRTINAAVDAIKPDEVLRVGGAGHKVLLVIEGKAHAYVFASRGCKKWDTCAPQAILESVGGKLTDMMGHELQYHKEVNHTNELGVLATYDALKAHPMFCSKVPDDIKASLMANQKL